MPFGVKTEAKYLNNREEMNQALTNFTDAHNSLIQNKDDYMTNQSLGAVVKTLKFGMQKARGNQQMVVVIFVDFCFVV